MKTNRRPKGRICSRYAFGFVPSTKSVEQPGLDARGRPANATSHWIFIEVDRDDATKLEPLDVYGPDGNALERIPKAVEEPGRYFNALLGVLITGAARAQGPNARQARFKSFF